MTRNLKTALFRATIFILKWFKVFLKFKFVQFYILLSKNIIIMMKNIKAAIDFTLDLHCRAIAAYGGFMSCVKS